MLFIMRQFPKFDRGWIILLWTMERVIMYDESRTPEIQFLDRSKKAGWIKYMEMNPLYFEMVFGFPFEKELLEELWLETKEEMKKFLT